MDCCAQPISVEHAMAVRLVGGDRLWLARLGEGEGQNQGPTWVRVRVRVAGRR